MRIKLLILTLLSLFSGVGSVFANGIILNEIMANPNDNTEWIELYNPTNQTIDLSNWKIKDGNNITSDDLTLSGQINPSSFITFDHNKGWLNDSGSETVTLTDNNGQIIDSYQYSGTIRGKTYGRQPDNGSWIANLEPSKGSANGGPIPTLTPAPTPSSTPTPSSPTPTPSSTPIPTSTPTHTTVATPKTVNTISKTINPTLSPTTSQSFPQNQTITGLPSKSLVTVEYKVASVAGVNSFATQSATPSAKIEVKNQKQINPLLLVGIGLIFAGTSSLGYIYFKRKRL